MASSEKTFRAHQRYWSTHEFGSWWWNKNVSYDYIHVRKRCLSLNIRQQLKQMCFFDNGILFLLDRCFSNPFLPLLHFPAQSIRIENMKTQNRVHTINLTVIDRQPVSVAVWNRISGCSFSLILLMQNMCRHGRGQHSIVDTVVHFGNL